MFGRMGSWSISPIRKASPFLRLGTDCWATPAGARPGGVAPLLRNDLTTFPLRVKVRHFSQGILDREEEGEVGQIEETDNVDNNKGDTDK